MLARNATINGDGDTNIDDEHKNIHYERIKRLWPDNNKNANTRVSGIDIYNPNNLGLAPSGAILDFNEIKFGVDVNTGIKPVGSTSYNDSSLAYVYDRDVGDVDTRDAASIYASIHTNVVGHLTNKIGRFGLWMYWNYLLTDDDNDLPENIFKFDYSTIYTDLPDNVSWDTDEFGITNINRNDYLSNRYALIPTDDIRASNWEIEGGALWTLGTGPTADSIRQESNTFFGSIRNIRQYVDKLPGSGRGFITIYISNPYSTIANPPNGPFVMYTDNFGVHEVIPSEDDIPGRVYTKTRTHNVDGAKDISLGTFFTNTPAYRNDDDESVQSNIDIKQNRE